MSDADNQLGGRGGQTGKRPGGSDHSDSPGQEPSGQPSTGEELEGEQG